MDDTRALVRKYVNRAIDEDQGYLIVYYRQGDDGAVRFMAGYITQAMRGDGVTPPDNDDVDRLIREIFDEGPCGCIDDCDDRGEEGDHGTSA
jgi:hypothetical protein